MFGCFLRTVLLHTEGLRLNSKHLSHPLQSLPRWFHIPQFPIDNRVRTYANHGSKLLDHEPPVHASLADMFAKCLWLFRICRIEFDEIEAQFEGVEGLRKVVFL